MTGSLTSAVTVASGAILGGTGTTGAVAAAARWLRASAAWVPSRQAISVFLPAAYNIDLTDSGADQLVVAGTVNLGNATLNMTSSRTNVGGVVVLINNDGTDAVTGTFAGLSEGASAVTVGGLAYHITYQYDSATGQFGVGNDIAVGDVAYWQ